MQKLVNQTEVQVWLTKIRMDKIFYVISETIIKKAI